jgi:hypothetical protein
VYVRKGGMGTGVQGWGVQKIGKLCVHTKWMIPNRLTGGYLALSLP